MPFLGTIWILPKYSLVLNVGAIFTACLGPVKMAQKFETSLDLGRITGLQFYTGEAFVPYRTRISKKFSVASSQENICY